MRSDRRRLDSRGTSTLELVLVLPTLLFVIFAGIELSRAWFTMNLMTTAAREGARIGSVSGATGLNEKGAKDRMTALLASGGLTGATVKVECIGACAPDAEVKATVTYQFDT